MSDLNSISHDDYLAVKGMFTLANEHSEKAAEYDRALHKFMGEETGSHISDAIWGYPENTLEDALENMGIGIEEASQNEE